MEPTSASTSPFTHAHDGELAVFLIGMVVNKPWRPDLWMPTFVAMPAMLRELETERAGRAPGQDGLGFLGARTLVGAGGPTVVQWWLSVEHIYAYARKHDSRHLPAWRAFNRRARKHPDAVGIWHETYRVPPGGHESIYVGMAPLGLSRVTGAVDVMERGRTARERLRSAAAS